MVFYSVITASVPLAALTYRLGVEPMSWIIACNIIAALFATLALWRVARYSNARDERRTIAIERLSSAAMTLAQMSVAALQRYELMTEPEAEKQRDLEKRRRELRAGKAGF